MKFQSHLDALKLSVNLMNEFKASREIVQSFFTQTNAMCKSRSSERTPPSIIDTKKYGES